MRWGVLDMDVSGVRDLEALLDLAAQGVRLQLAETAGRVLGLRIQLAGAGPLYKELAARPEVLAEQLRAMALDVSSGSAWIEKVDCRVRPALDLEKLALGDDPVGLLVRELRSLSGDSSALALLANDTLMDLKQKLPVEISQDDTLLFDTPDVLKGLLGEAEADLIARLASEGRGG